MDQPDHVAAPPPRVERDLLYHQLLTDLTIIRALAQIIDRRAQAGTGIDGDDVMTRVRQIDAATDRLSAGLDRLRRDETSRGDSPVR